MTDYCQKNNVEVLSTAHHIDDRIENFFIRIYRGSGLLGLVDKEEITYNNIQIIRPLFDVSKDEILKYLEENLIKYIKDPSNEDTKYLRSNIRAWLKELPKDLNQDLFKKRVISVKDNLERASKIIEKIFEKELKNNVKIFDEGYAKITKLTQDKEVAYMIIAEVLKIVSGDNSQIRLGSIKELYNELSSKGNIKKTLAGCFIEKNKEEIIIYREFGKSPPKDVTLEDGAIWDGRFVVSSSYSDSPTPIISYLKESEYREIKDKITLNDNLKRNKKIIFTLPTVKYLEKVIAIPHINYYDGAYDNLADKISFEFKRINNE
jgi:tRNA(Ile)-lysidine synthase